MIFSFFKTLITQPGYVTEENNDRYILLYCSLRGFATERANRYNENTKTMIRPPNSDGYESYSECEMDDYTFEKNEYHIALYNQCKNKLKLNVKMCKKCHLTKLPGMHHCPDCHRCIYMQDHHCVWFCKCIGQFNQKFFILFSLYWFCSSLISLFMTIWYYIKPSPMKIFTLEKFKIFMIVMHVLLDGIFSVLAVKLLWDQYDNLGDNAVVYDFKRNKMVEIRTKTEVMMEIFGSEPSIGWLFPGMPGGFYLFYLKKEKNKEEKEKEKVKSN